MPETALVTLPLEDRAPAGTLRRAAEDFIGDLRPFITHLETTAEDSWCTDVVRSPDGSANCVFGHLFQYAADRASDVELPGSVHGRTDRHGRPLPAAEVFANAVWNEFEESWSTTYAVYPVNDGANPHYTQPTPKGRVIAYLRALAAGEEETTVRSMDRAYQEILEREAAEAAAQQAGPTDG